MILRCGSRTLDISTPRVMGVLNLTPDSFYDGGRYCDGAGPLLEHALVAADKMHTGGADIIDIGGESTRPGAARVSEQQECDRVLPVVEALSARLDVVLSIDTSTPAVIAQAARLGAGMINDVRALTRPKALAAALGTKLPLCLMHMQGMPATMQHNPCYGDVVAEVKRYLEGRIAAVVDAAGAEAPQILIDPGFGFGKTDGHNIALLKQLSEFADLACPILVGLSRKSLLGRLLGREADQRLAGSLALALMAVQNGANIVRVHDVAETSDIVKLFNIMKTGTVIDGA